MNQNNKNPPPATDNKGSGTAGVLQLNVRYETWDGREQYGGLMFHMSGMIKPVKKQTEMNITHILHQSDGDPVNKDWLLLDSQFNITVFYNPKFLHNIKTANSILTVHCNAGASKTKLISDFLGYETVWFLPNRITNILFLAQVVR